MVLFKFLSIAAADSVVHAQIYYRRLSVGICMRKSVPNTLIYVVIAD